MVVLLAIGICTYITVGIIVYFKIKEIFLDTDGFTEEMVEDTVILEQPSKIIHVTDRQDVPLNIQGVTPVMAVEKQTISTHDGQTNGWWV